MIEIPRNTVVYDLEIKNNIDGNNITWDDHDKMGLSTLQRVEFDVKNWFK